MAECLRILVLKAVSVFGILYACFLTAVADQSQLRYYKIINAKATDNPFRLEKNDVEPIKYELEITLPKNFAEDPKFSGTVKITIALKQGVDNTKKPIFLHYKYLTIKNLQLTKPSTDDDLILTNEYDETHEMVKLELKEELSKSIQYTLKANYEGKLRSDGRGFYFSKYKDVDGIERSFVATHLQPTYARWLMPCFDEPKYKAKFKLTLKYPEPYKALFNTKSTSSKRNSETGIVTDEFKVTPKIPTYLLAIVIAYFSKKDSETSDQHTAWNRYPNNLFWVDHGVNQSPKLIKKMEELTGKVITDFDTQINHVVFPNAAYDAVGSWGLATYSETQFLYHKKLSTTKDKEKVCSNVANALSQFWFGNIITVDWWDHIWLNRGFAKYLGYLAIDQENPKWQLERQFVVEQWLTAMQLDSLPSSEALDYNVETPLEIATKFNDLSSSKGASLLRMIHQWVGNKEFKEVLKRFVGSAETPAGPQNLWTVIKNASPNLPEGTTVAEIMNKYINQAGLPRINVNLEKTTVKITQGTKFAFSKSSQPTKPYYIPITYTKGTSLDFSDTGIKCWLSLLEDDECKISNVGPDTTIIVNLKATAYARVHYEWLLYKRIIDVLEKDHTDIDVLNRVQIVDDALNFARAGDLLYQQALEIVSYLKKEESYYPWYAAFKGFEHLLKRLPNKTKEGKLLRRYILSLMTTISKEKDENEHIEALRITLTTRWRCNLAEKECTDKMEDLFDKDIAKKETEIDADIRSSVYCTALRMDTTEKRWNLLFERFTKTVFPPEVRVILSALGCTSHLASLNTYLKKSIVGDSEIPRQYAATVFSSVVAGSHNGVQTALNFFTTEHTKILERYGEKDTIISILNVLFDHFTKKDQIKEFENFLEKHSFVYKDDALMMLEVANENIEWANAIKQDITMFLHQLYPPNPPDPTTSPSPNPTNPTYPTKPTNPTKPPTNPTPQRTTPKSKSNSGFVKTDFANVVFLICNLFILLKFY